MTQITAVPSWKLGGQKVSVDSLLLSSVQLSTYLSDQLLTCASGFFFQRDDRLFLVTSRHVLIDEACAHRPDRVDIGLHTDPLNLATATRLSISLYQAGCPVWREITDQAGLVDIAAIEVPQSAIPPSSVFFAFSPAHLPTDPQPIEVGATLSIVGFPRGFHDTLHHMPVVRAATLASQFGLRFQGQGYFLTDARTHRGSSGAPVVARAALPADASLPWVLLGVHSSRLDVSPRDESQDEALGLNCAWYSNSLLALTQD